MIAYYLKLASKTLNKNRYYAFINVFGLVCGTLAALIIAKYIGGSLQFDAFHVKKEHIYSLIQQETVNNNPQKPGTGSYWGVGELIKQYPEVANVTRCNYTTESLVITNDDKGNSVSYTENRILAIDSNFLKTFTFPLLHGNQQTALLRMHSILLTSPTSRKYFGDINPVGKTLVIRLPWGPETTYTVTGVLEEFSPKTQFKFDLLITSPPLDAAEFWIVPGYNTYALLNENTKMVHLSEKLANDLKTIPELNSENKAVNVLLESSADVQLTATEYLLGAVGIFILVISWVNYINQIVAQSYSRMKEIGILRVMGASRTSLKIQFAVESAVICGISLILTIAIYMGIEPSLQSFTHGHLLPLIGDPTPVNFIFIAILSLGIILASSIPVVIFFSENSGATIRNTFWDKVGGIGLRKVLVVVQFSISAILIISILVITEQLEFMKSKDKGLNMENVLVVKAPIIKDTTWIVKRKTLQLFKERCGELPFVNGITSSTTVAGEEYRQETYIGFPDKRDKFLVHQNGIDEYFFHLYDVEFLAGQNFIPDANAKNRSSIILNQSAARNLGISNVDEAIGAKIVNYESNEVYDLVGIIKDYHQTSLKYEMRPMAFKFNTFRGHISLRINTAERNGEQLQAEINSIKQIWEEIYHDASFDYFFLDKRFEAQDLEDHYFGKLFQYFTALSIIISCLGLFGLSLFISIKRQKEIGVRKVFGASIKDILVTSYKSYFSPLTISVLIGSPVALMLMNTWLSTYAYRIDIGIDTVLTALIILTVIFLVTVSYHTIRSSMANPVKVLKAD